MQEFNKIKSFRTGAGITQDQMAEALGISKQTYTTRENGTSDWKLSEMNAFTDTVNKATGQNYSVKDIFFQITIWQNAKNVLPLSDNGIYYIAA